MRRLLAKAVALMVMLLCLTANAEESAISKLRNEVAQAGYPIGEATEAKTTENALAALTNADMTTSLYEFDTSEQCTAFSKELSEGVSAPCDQYLFVTSEEMNGLQEALLAAVQGDAVPPYAAQTDGTLVWIPTKGGKKYHSNSQCSNMIEPEQVDIEQAVQLGFTPCKRCNAPA